MAYSKGLRGSDPQNFTTMEIYEKLKESEKDYLNEKLEDNYRRGFHQAIEFVRYLMEKQKISHLDQIAIKELAKLAEQMRYKRKNGKPYSYSEYGSIFISMAEKLEPRILVEEEQSEFEQYDPDGYKDDDGGNLPNG